MWRFRLTKPLSIIEPSKTNELNFNERRVDSSFTYTSVIIILLGWWWRRWWWWRWGRRIITFVSGFLKCQKIVRCYFLRRLCWSYIHSLYSQIRLIFDFNLIGFGLSSVVINCYLIIASTVGQMCFVKYVLNQNKMITYY